MSRRLQCAAVIMGAAMVVTGCSGVPTSSSPEVIGPARDASAASPQPVVQPEPNADPSRIVYDFLKANVGEPDDPRRAHVYLTDAEQSKWSDSTVTILQEFPRISPASGGRTQQTVTASGVQVGRLAADGTYTPDPAASGGGGQPVSFQFTLRLVKGQWRISDLPDGLVVTDADFGTDRNIVGTYRESKLYYYDLSEQHLVPDPRYTALTDVQAVASWQLRQLLEGPRSQLESAVHTELPSQQSLTARASVTVTPGPFVSVELPGSSQLDRLTKLNLAAQLTATLATQAGTIMTITDGGKPVDIPNLPERFSKDDVSAATGQFGSANLPVYFIDALGRLVERVDDTDSLIGKSPLGDGGAYHLRSVAVAARGSADYEVAATIGAGNSQTLWIGTFKKGLRKTALGAGPLTRPSWAPSLHEAWVGDGTRIYRVGANSGIPISVPTGLAGGRITALRFSPEGSRLAMIVAAPNGASQVWVGAVVRSGQSVRIDNPEPITPPDYVLNDVAWNDDTTLYIVGHNPNADTWVWQVQVDGAYLQPRSSAGLPSMPDSITASGGQSVWASVGRSVYQEATQTAWVNPGDDPTLGTNPLYLE